MSSVSCSQCEKPAVVRYEDIPLCVDHHLKMQQASYLQLSQLADELNVVRGEIEQGVGLREGSLPRYQIPRPPFIGNQLTLHNINVSQSAVGTINTGTVQNLDSCITLVRNRGEDELADAIKEFTETLLASNEVTQTAGNEIAEQLNALTA